MSMANSTNIDQEKLRKLWTTYINDSSLFTKTTFGKFAHDRVMKKRWCWPALYYAQGNAYDLLYKHIHYGETEGIRQVS